MGILLLFITVIFHCIPEVVSLLIVYGMNNVTGMKLRRRKLIIFLGTAFINGICYVLAHRYILIRWNVLKTIKEVVTLELTYGYLEYLALSFLLCFFVAVILGLIIVYIMRCKGSENTVSARKKCVFFLGIVAEGIIIYSLYNVSMQGVDKLVINEICIDNELIAVNEEDVVADYIELYNAGDMCNSLDEVYISDDYNDLKKLQIPVTMIPAKGYVVIPLVDESIALKKSGGETIYLSDERGKILDQVTTCELDYDQAYARVGDGGKDWKVVGCTPGKTNNDAEQLSKRYVDPPRMSKISGFYTDEFELVITADVGNEVYYTLDGTTPTKENAILYQNPILITDASKNENVLSARKDFSANEYYIPDYLVDKGTVIKARAYDTEENYSDVVTAIFFVNGKDNILSDKYVVPNIPVLSLVADPDDLCGYDRGILVLGHKFDEYIASLNGESVQKENLYDYKVIANFNQKGRAWERKAQLSFFENGELRMEQEVGIRKRGKSSSAGAQKGFNIYAREFYSDTASFEHDVFHTGEVTDKITLKYGNCLLKDGFITDLVADRDLIPFHYSPVSFFLNGEYWGTYTMVEKYGEDFFENYYGINSVTIFCNGVIDIGNQQDNLRDVIKWAGENDLSDEFNYATISEIVDLQSLIDYYCTRIYMDDIDSHETYNMMAWKPQLDENNPYADGKWHWAIYDIDASLIDYTRNNLTEQIREGRPAFLEHILIKALLQNEDFKKRFIISFTDMMNFNFSPDIVLPLYEERISELYNALQYNQLRFYGESLDDNKFEVEKEFYQNRSVYVLKYLREAFDLNEPVEMSVFTSEGTAKVQINTSCVQIDEVSNNMTYFPDMEIQLSVLPESEENFSEWIIRENDNEWISTDLSITLEPREGTEIILVTK